MKIRLTVPKRTPNRRAIKRYLREVERSLEAEVESKLKQLKEDRLNLRILGSCEIQ